LWSHKPMGKNYENPILKKGEAEALKFDDLPSAIEGFFTAWDALQDKFSEDPEYRVINPVFGSMDQEMFDLLNAKHYNHHFKQFGLEV